MKCPWAFPAISCGAYGYPLELAAQVALGALRNGLEKEIVDTIFFYHFGATNYTTWRALAARHLGAPKA